MAETERRTFRVRQIPDFIKERDLLKLLKRMLNYPDSTDGITVFSLAPDVESHERPPAKVATVGFEKRPAQLATTEDEWYLSRDGFGLPHNLVVDTHFRGFTVLNEVNTDEHAVDCFAISGLASHPFGSWKARDKTSHFMWLRDSLPMRHPGIRSIIYGYDTHLPGSKAFKTIEDISISLIGHLRSIGCSSPSAKPTIFLAHSLGGLVLKQALVRIASSSASEQHMLFLIKKIILFGVPNRGMTTSHPFPMVDGQPNELLVGSLSHTNPYLRRLDETFSGISYLRGTKIISVYETPKSSKLQRIASGRLGRGGPDKVLVEKPLASHRHSHDRDTHLIDTDHSNLVKFAEGDPNLHVILDFLNFDDAAISRNLEHGNNDVYSEPDPQKQHRSDDFAYNIGAEKLVRLEPEFNNDPDHPIEEEIGRDKPDHISMLHPFSDSGYCTNSMLPNEETMTIMTDDRDFHIPENIKETCIAKFVEELHRSLDMEQIISGGIERFRATLVLLLRTYAMRLEHTIPMVPIDGAIHDRESQSSETDAISFVRHFRMHIASHATKLWSDNLSSTPSSSSFDRHRQDAPMKPEEKINLLWHQDERTYNGNAEGPNNAVQDIDRATELGEVDLEGNQDVELAAVEFAKYRAFLIESVEYKWLIETLKSELNLQEEINSNRKAINQKLLNRLSLRGTATVLFHIDWDPLAFMEAQDYKISPSEAIAQAITLTGSIDQVQALSCEKYMEQIWPISGNDAIQTLQRAVADENYGTWVTGKSQNSVDLRIQVLRGHVFAEVKGMPEDIAEVGEQFAWLGSALRCYSDTEEMAYCVPRLLNKIMKANYSFLYEGKAIPEVIGLSYLMEPIRNGSFESSANGYCWRKLFRNRVIAQGYPVKHRPKDLKGLELPLNMMAKLGGVQFLDSFNDQILFKDFRTAFVLTTQTPNISVWHFVSNRDSRPLHFGDPQIRTLRGISGATVDISELGNKRNIVGWASLVAHFTGCQDRKYKVLPSRSSRPSHRFALEKVSISVSKILTGGATFAVGRGDSPFFFSQSDSYVGKILSAQERSVVLYDLEDRRGWLVNGASALLHLVCASLSLDEAKNLPDGVFRFNWKHLQDDQKHGYLSARDVLLDKKNMMLEIFENPEERWIDESGLEKKKIEMHRFVDRVQYFYQMLEKVQEAQSDDTTGIEIRGTDRDKLEGYDFHDIASKVNPLKARVAYLNASGRGWVELVRAINAVALFGRGFGEILRPVYGANQLCQQWRTAPTGMDYLIASTPVLRKIFETDGTDKAEGPLQIMEGIHWYPAAHIFENCIQSDEGSLSRCCCERVNALLPSSSIGRHWSPRFSIGIKPDPRIFDGDGAVIIGRNRRIAWNFPKKVASSGLNSIESYPEEDLDSGLSTSIQTTTPNPSYDSNNSSQQTEPSSLSDAPSTNRPELFNTVVKLGGAKNSHEGTSSEMIGSNSTTSNAVLQGTASNATHTYGDATKSHNEKKKRLSWSILSKFFRKQPLQHKP